METITTPVTLDFIKNAMTYPEYKERIYMQMKNGEHQSESKDFFTRLNLTRMKRHEKRTHIHDHLKQELNTIPEKWFWLVIGEGWCGDGANNIPVIAKIADHSENIILRLILRDENPEIMDTYLTNGARSIPKLIAFKADGLVELGTWGPRPKPVQKLALNYKNDPTMSKDQFKESLQRWYNQDNAATLQEEFMALIKRWKMIESEFRYENFWN